MECCFTNIVDRHIDIIKKNDIFFLLLLKAYRLRSAASTPMELKTWMLGHTFVGVSIVYKNFIALDSISVSVISGLKS